MKLPRRDLTVAILTALTTLVVVTFAQTQPSTPPKAKARLGSAVYDWAKITAKPTGTGARRDFFDGPTNTLENFECHATSLIPGAIAHLPHRHPDEELIVVKEGTLEVTINGAAQQAGAGSVFFYASNDLHGMKNVGTTMATYYVFRFITAATPKATVN
jgi:quercetin dioxygenase-like cupin family protein